MRRDAKSVALYSVAVLILSVTLATVGRALILAHGADVFWALIVAACAVGGFGSAVVFLRDANKWAVAKFGDIIWDLAGFFGCSTFFFSVALHVLWFQWFKP